MIGYGKLTLSGGLSGSRSHAAPKRCSDLSMVLNCYPGPYEEEEALRNPDLESHPYRATLFAIKLPGEVPQPCCRGSDPPLWLVTQATQSRFWSKNLQNWKKRVRSPERRGRLVFVCFLLTGRGGGGGDKHIDNQTAQRAKDSRQALDLYDENKPPLIQSSWFTSSTLTKKWK